MKYSDIVRQFNVLLAGDNLSLREILPHLDYALDRINETLNTTYPTFSEYLHDDEGNTREAYNLFDNRYIRQVVLKGAAWHYYVTDEEGLQTSPQYQQDFENALFIMQRDMLWNIPEEFMADDNNGTLTANPKHWNLGYRGLQTYDADLI